MFPGATKPQLGCASSDPHSAMIYSSQQQHQQQPSLLRRSISSESISTTNVERPSLPKAISTSSLSAFFSGIGSKKRGRENSGSMDSPDVYSSEQGILHYCARCAQSIWDPLHLKSNGADSPNGQVVILQSPSTVPSLSMTASEMGRASPAVVVAGKEQENVGAIQGLTSKLLDIRDSQAESELSMSSDSCKPSPRKRHRTSSAAATFLSQFHRSPANSTVFTLRSRKQRKTNGSVPFPRTIPSLSYTPSTCSISSTSSADDAILIQTPDTYVVDHQDATPQIYMTESPISAEHGGKSDDFVDDHQVPSSQSLLEIAASIPVPCNGDEIFDGFVELAYEDQMPPPLPPPPSAASGLFRANNLLQLTTLQMTEVL